MNSAIKRFVAFVFALVVFCALCETDRCLADAVGKFDRAVPGPAIEVQIERRVAGKPVLVPASLVPYTKSGDVLIVKFPFANPSLQSHRFHALLANLSGIDTPKVDHYALFENQNYAKDFELTIRDGHTPVILFFPESGTQKGRGVPQMIDKLRGSPALFLEAATSAIDASQQHSRAEELLHALRTGLDKSLGSGHERLTAFASDLEINLDQSCFSQEPTIRTPCLIRSVTSQLQNVPHDATKLIGDAAASQIMRSIGPRYSLYLGAVLDLYFFFKRAQTPPQYKLAPGALITRGGQTVLGLDAPYNAEATPAPVAYVAVPAPTDAPPDTPTLEADPIEVTCLRGPSVALPVTIKGDTSDYAADWRLALSDGAGHAQNGIPIGPASPVSGAALKVQAIDSARFAALGRLKATVSARWGFDRIQSDAFNVALPQHAAWRADIYSAATAASSALIRISGAPAYCVDKISVRDALGRITTAIVNSRADTQAIATLDLHGVAPGNAQVVVEQDAKTVDEVPVSVPVTPANPQLIPGATPTPTPKPM